MITQENNLFKMEQKHVDALLSMGEKLHPHLGKDNHTNRLIIKALKENASLDRQDCFDLGKYYDRMLEFCKDNHNYISALIDLKGVGIFIKQEPCKRNGKN